MINIPRIMNTLKLFSKAKGFGVPLSKISSLYVVKGKVQMSKKLLAKMEKEQCQ